MILVDTMIWADHIASPDPRLSWLLAQDQVLSHPSIVGELALGNLRDRRVLRLFESLPRAVAARDWEVLAFIERHGLAGSGIGYVDAHLLLSVRLTDAAALWTRDRRLRTVAERLTIAWPSKAD